MLMVYPRMGICASWHQYGTGYEIGRIFIRVHSALGVEPQKAIRFVVSFDLIHSVTSPRQLHHLSRGVIYPTGLMKPKNQHFEMFFFTGLTSLSCPAPVTRTPRRTSPIASASLKITLRLLPGTVPLI